MSCADGDTGWTEVLDASCPLQDLYFELNGFLSRLFFFFFTSVPTFSVIPGVPRIPSPLMIVDDDDEEDDDDDDEDEPTEGVPLEQYRAWLGECKGLFSSCHIE